MPPLSPARLVAYERLAAPRAHGAVLIEPEPDQLRRLLAAAADDPRAGQPWLDTHIGPLRAALRTTLGLTGPVLVTGHQAEFFHAGVLAKNLAADALARQSGGSALFLLVDTDVPKSARVVIPQVTSHGLRRVDVAIPGADLQLPYLAQPPQPRAAWLQFFASLTALYAGGDRTLLPTYARGWLTTESATPAYCDALARAQSITEAALGDTQLRIARLSDVCRTPTFRAFVAGLVRAAPQCAAAYNAAQAAYRRRHHVRAAGRPVPPLIVDGATVELPLWAWRPGEPRRRLFVTWHGDQGELATDNRRLGRLARGALASHATHAEPWPLEREGWQLWPRALALSAFCRLFLGDLFIHGIGGAKYDELMEEFVEGWLGSVPAPCCCVSATLHLPLPHTPAGAADVRAARQRSRDLRYNPQRHLRAAPRALLQQRGELVRRADELRRDDPRNRAERRLVFQALRQTNAALLEADPWRAAQYDQQVQELETSCKLNRIAQDREYFYALHTPEELARLRATIAGELAS
jgi:hypothetical protein